MAIVCLCPSARTIGVVSLTITRWSIQHAAAALSGPPTYTISEYVTHGQQFKQLFAQVLTRLEAEAS
jgi:hypothetical protein